MNYSKAYDDSNVFAQILRGEVPSETLHETEHTLVVPDVRPQAPQHVLVIPKGQYITLDHFLRVASEAEKLDLLSVFGTMLERLELSKSAGGKGYRIITNAGGDGFQEVQHLHFHILGGRWLGPLLPGKDTSRSAVVHDPGPEQERLKRSGADRLLTRDSSFLVVVDIQEKLAPAIAGIEGIVATTLALIRAAQALGVPVVFTEHCPDRIGHTLPELLEAAPKRQVISKTHFGTLGEPTNREVFSTLLPRRPIVTGTEAHVCVLQTVFGLVEAGFDPLVVADGAGSRKARDRDTGIARMQGAGAGIVTGEMVIFEWLERADCPEFKALLPLIKSL